MDLPGWVPPPHTAQIPAGPHTLLCTRMLLALKVAAEHTQIICTLDIFCLPKLKGHRCLVFSYL